MTAVKWMNASWEKNSETKAKLLARVNSIKNNDAKLDCKYSRLKREIINL